MWISKRNGGNPPSLPDVIFGKKREYQRTANLADYDMIVVGIRCCVELYPPIKCFASEALVMDIGGPNGHPAAPQELIDLFNLVAQDGEEGPWRQFIDCLAQNTELMPDEFREVFLKAMEQEEGL